MPLALLGWWREIAIGLLVLAVGIAYHFYTVAASERDLLQAYQDRREQEDKDRAIANFKNKERTDAEHMAARDRAARVVVRVEGPGIKPSRGAEPAVGGNDAIACFDRGRLNEGIAGVIERHAARLTGSAREGEGVAAAFRACRAWALSLQ